MDEKRKEKILWYVLGNVVWVYCAYSMLHYLLFEVGVDYVISSVQWFDIGVIFIILFLFLSIMVFPLLSIISILDEKK